MPLDGLEALAAMLNAFQADPYQRGGPPGAPADQRIIAWLFAFAGISGHAFFPETVEALVRRVAGPELMARLRRCEVCERYMVARYRNRRRCGPACHARVWTRAYRRRPRRRGRRRGIAARSRS